MRVPVSAVFTIERAIDLPSRCPNCDAPLTEPDATRRYCLTEEVDSAHLVEGRGVVAEDGSEIENQGAGGRLVNTDLFCAACDHQLYRGQDGNALLEVAHRLRSIVLNQGAFRDGAARAWAREALRLLGEREPAEAPTAGEGEANSTP